MNARISGGRGLTLGLAIAGCLALLPASAGAAVVTYPYDGYSISINQPTFMFNSVNGSAVCQIDAGSSSPIPAVAASCGPSEYHSPAVLSDGPHSFTISDGGGPATIHFTVDTRGGGGQKPPQPVTPAAINTNIVSGPGGGATTSDTTPTFAFTANIANSTFVCSVDGSTPAACTSSFTTPALAGGPHTFSVAAVDPSGHVDPTPATASFAVTVSSQISIVSRHSHVSPTGRTTVRLTCSAGVGSCSGTLTLTKKLAVRVSRTRVVQKTYRLGGVKFSLAAGTSKTLTLTLTSQARSRMRRADDKRLVIRSTAVSAANTAANAVEFTLR
jgi:hypothetical protein